MAKTDLEVDVLEMFNKFKELTAKEMDMAVKKAITKAAREIREKTVQNAESGIKTYNNHPDGPYNGDTILDAPRVSRIEDRYDEDSLSIKVHVMGTRKSDSQTYRFRFLEKGTKDRYQLTYRGKELKKPRYLGSIKPRHYFRKANEETNVESIYVKEIDEAINKINNGR